MKTLSEFCRELGIKEEDVLCLYSVAREIVHKRCPTECEKLFTAIYAVLRKQGKIDEAKKIEKYVNGKLLMKLIPYCDRCVDFNASMKNLILKKFNLSGARRRIFEKEYESICEKFKDKTLTFAAYATIAYIALCKAGEYSMIEDFAKKVYLTPVTLRYWSKKLFEKNLSEVIQE